MSEQKFEHQLTIEDFSFVTLPSDAGFAPLATWKTEAIRSRNIFKVPFSSIKIVSDWNPRTSFDGIEELALDIQTNGQLEPLHGDLSKDGTEFYLRDGERRYRAISLLVKNGIEFEQVEVVPYSTKMLESDKFIANLASDKKSKYPPIDMANAVLKLKEHYNLSNEEIGTKMGYSRQWVDNMVRLAKGPEEIKEQVSSGELNATKAVKQIAERTKPSDEMSGLIKPASHQSGDSRLTGIGDDIMGGGNDALGIKTETETIADQFYKNLAKIEGFGKGLNEQAQGDLNHVLNFLRSLVETVTAPILAAKNSFPKLSIDAINMLITQVNANHISDGYHTFKELYDHRIALFIAYCREVDHQCNIPLSWKSCEHSDGSEWDGWFIMGTRNCEQETITYHLPIEYWDSLADIPTVDQAPEWDGHTSADVVTRLLKR